MIKIKRVYEKPTPSDGKRILIDRLWPRGLSKDKAKIDLWLKDIAPSTNLRQWFNHDPDKWLEFRRRYRLELDSNSSTVNKLRAELKAGPSSLVYSAKDEQYNDAVVLKDYFSK